MADGWLIMIACCQTTTTRSEQPVDQPVEYPWGLACTPDEILLRCPITDTVYASSLQRAVVVRALTYTACVSLRCFGKVFKYFVGF